MAAKSPLQMIYEGKFPENLLAPPASLALSQKVEQVVTRYHQLLQRFPPDTLESLGRLPPEMLQEMAEIGLFGLSIPAAYGGLGFSIREWLKVVEEMVRLDMASALASLAHLSIGVKGIELFGNESQKQKYLVPAASGAMIFSYALTEPRVGSDAQHIETRAETIERWPPLPSQRAENLHHQCQLRRGSYGLRPDGPNPTGVHGRLHCGNRVGWGENRERHAQDGAQSKFYGSHPIPGCQGPHWKIFWELPGTVSRSP